jgi:CDP-diacylglycerol--glycerol-3-phosphate 3-phosphatidyltransferase
VNRPAARAPLVNAANILTAVRLVLVPGFVAAIIGSGLTHTGWRVAATAIFLIASLTDFVDGWIARRYDLITAFGKIADPIADKALTGTALILLSGYGALPWWVTVVILGREVGITLLRFWVIRHGVIAASRGGKWKTGLQIAAIAWYVLFAPAAGADWALPEPLALVGPWLMGVAVAVTVVTGLDYVVRALRLRATGR